MVIRIWSGRADPGRRDAYPAHFRQNVLPALRRMPGFRGAQLLQGEAGGLVEYVVQTRWDSMAAISGFAGADPEQALVEPEAVAALVDFDARVRHYTLVAEVE